MVNHYFVLGVPSTASQHDIKAAFRTIALASHPDRHPNDPGAADRFKAANAAYAVLSDPAQRANHDAELARAAGAPSAARVHAARRSEPSTPPRAESRPADFRPPPPAAAARPASQRAASGGGGLGWLFAALGAVAVGVAAATSNTWDDGTERYRSRSTGQFRSGRWG